MIFLLITGYHLNMELRKYSIDDKLPLQMLLNNFEVSQWTAGIPYPFTLEDSINWINKQNTREHCYVISNNKGLVGDIGLYPVIDNCYELGYWIGQDYWGKGYATEACKALLELVKNKIPSEKIFATCQVGNSASEKILNNLGFKEIEQILSFSKARNKETACLKYQLKN